MVNIKEKNELLQVKGSKGMYVWVTGAYLIAIISCLVLIIQGFKFNSNYSLIYIFGGIMLTPIFLYLILWSLPGFNPWKILLTIIPGENGKVFSKKGTVIINDIRNIDLVRNPFNLINYIVIETFDEKKLKIPTYNLIDDLDYQVMVDQYMFPYMTESARKVWDRKIDLNVLLKEVRYERQEQKIE
ncbi:DUF5381 family protein [Peribacillus loiseleuriae]|uniref:DUF5381 family protein n=1 Tax=Peribacillus loiseleuriae TaxID=1679170 RepID=UPI003D03D39C